MFSHVQLFATPWTAALPGFSVHGESPGKNTWVGCYALLQKIFLTQGSNPGLPYCRWILYCLSHQRIPIILLSCDICSEFSMLIFHIRMCFSNYIFFSKSFNLSFTKTQWREQAVVIMLSCFFFFPFCKWGNGTQAFNDKSKAIHSMCDQTKTRTQLF